MESVATDAGRSSLLLELCICRNLIPACDPETRDNVFLVSSPCCLWGCLSPHLLFHPKHRHSTHFISSQNTESRHKHLSSLYLNSWQKTSTIERVTDGGWKIGPFPQHSPAQLSGCPHRPGPDPALPPLSFDPQPLFHAQCINSFIYLFQFCWGCFLLLDSVFIFLNVKLLGPYMDAL